MSDFLVSLVDRSRGAEQTLRPRLPSRYEPLRAAPVLSGDAFDQLQAPNPETHPDLGSQPISAIAPLPFLSRRESSTEATQHENRLSPSADAANWNAQPSESFGDGAASPQGDSLAETNRSSHLAPALESSFDPQNDQWLTRRLEEVARQIQQLRREQTDSRGLAPPLSSPAAEAAPTLLANKPPAITSDRFTLRSNREQPAVDEQNSVRQAFTVAKPNPPPLSSLTPPQSSRLESQNELRSLLAATQVQPVPKIVPENLSSVPQRSAASQPTINVTIGRVEVKATREAAPAARPARAPANPSVMSLQDYLQRRAAGGLS